MVDNCDGVAGAREVLRRTGGQNVEAQVAVGCAGREPVRAGGRRSGDLSGSTQPPALLAQPGLIHTINMFAVEQRGRAQDLVAVTTPVPPMPTR
ncbi:MAG: hypothetical protein U0Z44_16800 [Kouleothrix sp.]